MGIVTCRCTSIDEKHSSINIIHTHSLKSFYSWNIIRCLLCSIMAIGFLSVKDNRSVRMQITKQIIGWKCKYYENSIHGNSDCPYLDHLKEVGTTEISHRCNVSLLVFVIHSFMQFISTVHITDPVWKQQRWGSNGVTRITRLQYKIMTQELQNKLRHYISRNHCMSQILIQMHLKWQIDGLWQD